MATIAEQLTQLNAIKQNFKTKFTEKGVNVAGVPFTSYPNLLDEIGDSNPEVEHSGRFYTFENGTDLPATIKSVKYFICDDGADQSNMSSYNTEVTDSTCWQALDGRTDTRWDSVATGKMVELFFNEPIRIVTVESYTSSNVVADYNLYYDIYGYNGNSWMKIGATERAGDDNWSTPVKDVINSTDTVTKFTGFRFVMRHNIGLTDGRYMHFADVNISQWITGGNDQSVIYSDYASVGGALPSSPWVFTGKESYRSYTSDGYIYLKSTNGNGDESTCAKYSIYDNFENYSNISYTITAHGTGATNQGNNLNNRADLMIKDGIHVSARFKSTIIDIVDHGSNWNKVLYTHNIEEGSDHTVNFLLEGDMLSVYIDDVRYIHTSTSLLGVHTEASVIEFGCSNPWDSGDLYVKNVEVKIGTSSSGGNTGTITTKTQQLSQKTNTLNGGQTQTLTFTFSDLSQVLGITDISGCIEYVWLQSMAINGNVVTAVVGNKRSAGDGKSTTIKLTAIGTGSDTAQPTWVSKTGTLASSSVSGTFNPAWQTDDVVKTQTIDLSSPTKVTSVYLYSGTRRVDNNGWCNGRVTLTGKTASGSTVTLLNKYTDFGRDGKTVELNNDSELVSVTWTWYTPDSTSRDYNVNQNGSISAWQVQE